MIKKNNSNIEQKHFTKELYEINIPFERVNAVTCEDQEVKNLYRTNSVKSFPPCFRCKENQCDHENNYLAPKQCANFKCGLLISIEQKELDFDLAVEMISHINFTFVRNQIDGSGFFKS